MIFDPDYQEKVNLQSRYNDSSNKTDNGSKAKSAATTKKLIEVDITEIPIDEIKESQIDFLGSAAGQSEWQPSELLPGLFFMEADSIKLLRRLGSGSFGIVYLASYKGRFVAVKELNIAHAKEKLPFLFATDAKQGEQDLHEAFESEIRGLKGLTHPNIVGYEGVLKTQDKEHNPRCAIVMEFCQRGSLEDVVEKLYQQGKRLSNACIWRLAYEMIQGLHYLHSQGLFHHDLKTDNILLNKQDKAKIADFGVAGVDSILNPGKEAEVVAQGVRDFQWQSPEEFLKGPTAGTIKADIYSVALILYHLLTGQKPYASYSYDEIRSLVAKGNFRETIPDYCPDSLRNLIELCWHPDPDLRPSTEKILLQLEEMAHEFHPKSEVVKLTQQLDIHIDGHRKIFPHYIEPYTTAIPIDEDPDRYWQRFEKNSDLKEEEKEDTQKSSNTDMPILLKEKYNLFLENKKSLVLVLVGDGEGGLGKSLSSIILADRLLHTKQWLPIFIRPGITFWSVSNLQDGINKSLTSKVYRLNSEAIIRLKMQPVLFIVDEIDELQLDEAISNLAEVLKVKDWPNAKLIFITRRQIGKTKISSAELSQWFSVDGKYEVCYLLPFRLDQTFSYLKQTLNWSEEINKQYEELQYEAPELRAALRNPFVLQIFVQCFAIVSKMDLKTITRRKIYFSFIKYWLTTNCSLLPGVVLSKLISVVSRAHSEITTPSSVDMMHDLLVESFSWFSEQVSFYLYERNDLSASVDSLKSALELPDQEIKDDTDLLSEIPPTRTRSEAITQVEKEINPWLILQELVKDAAARNFADSRLNTQNASGKKRNILQLDDYIKIALNNFKIFLASGPLNIHEGIVSYKHKTYYEYFVGEFISRHCRSTTDQDGEKSLAAILNVRNLQEETSAVDFVKDSTNADLNRKAAPVWAGSLYVNPIELSLLKQIKLSSMIPTNAQAAGNAFTILNRAGVYISGMDFPGIHAKNADCSCGVITASNFPDSVFENFNFTDGYLVGNNFNNAIFIDVNFSEKPSIAIKEKVIAIAYSPDGKFIAIAGLEEKEKPKTKVPKEGREEYNELHPEELFKVNNPDKITTLYFYEMRSNQLLFLFKVNNKISNMVFSPDSKTLTYWCGKKITLFDIEDKDDFSCLNGFEDVNSVVFSPDNTTLISVGADKKIHLWNYKERKLIYSLEGHTKPIKSVAFNQTGFLAATISDDETLKIWDIVNKSMLHNFDGVEALSVRFLQDVTMLVTGSFDGKINFWSIETKSLVYTIHAEYALSHLEFSKQGNYIASYHSKMINVWDIYSKKLLYSLQGHANSISAAAISADGKVIASASENIVLQSYSARRSHSNLNEEWFLTINCMAVSPSENLIASSRYNAIHLWNLNSKRIEHTFFLDKRKYVTCLRFSSSGDKLASAIYVDEAETDCTISIWDVNKKSLLTSFNYQGEVSDLAFVSDDKAILITSRRDDTSLLNLIDGECLGITGPFENVATNKKNKIFIMNRGNGYIYILPEEQKEPGDHNEYLNEYEIAKREKEIAEVKKEIAEREKLKREKLLAGPSGWYGYGSGYGSSSAYETYVNPYMRNADPYKRDHNLEVQTSLPFFKFKHKFKAHDINGCDHVSCQDFGDIFASSGSSLFFYNIIFWNAISYKKIGTLRGHKDYIYSHAFSPDGKLFASSSCDNTIRVWNVDSRKSLLTVNTNETILNIHWKKNNSNLFLIGRGRANHNINVWEIINDSSHLAILLRWRSSFKATLNLSNTSFASAQIDPLNSQILEKNGAIGKPLIRDESNNEKNKKSLKSQQKFGGFFYRKSNSNKFVADVNSQSIDKVSKNNSDCSPM